MDILFFAIPLLLVAGAYLRPAEEQVSEVTQRYGSSRQVNCGCTAGC